MNTEELLYCDTHEWVFVSEEDGQKIATVGISAFAVEQLTDFRAVTGCGGKEQQRRANHDHRAPG